VYLFLQKIKIKKELLMKKKNNAGGYERIKIGTNIRKWRSIKEMKQKDLAHGLRMSEAAVSNLENDLTDITLSLLEDIAIVLDIELEQLFSDPQEMVEKNYSATEQDKKFVMEPEWIYALIGSIQKKDEQLKTVLDNFILNPGYVGRGVK
jgi:transcriptional regulator with XRE-family HTH domain